MGEPKYKSLAELHAAVKAGELPDGAILLLDNDCASMYTECEVEPGEFYIDECLFRVEEPPEHSLLPAALELLGIPFDHV